jgi:hypothetical protein
MSKATDAEITAALVADRLRAAEIITLPRASLNRELVAALVVSGCAVERARDILETATWANALAADDQPTDLTKAN